MPARHCVIEITQRVISAAGSAVASLCRSDPSGVGRFYENRTNENTHVLAASTKVVAVSTIGRAALYHRADLPQRLSPPTALGTSLKSQHISTFRMHFVKFTDNIRHSLCLPTQHLEKSTPHRKVPISIHGQRSGFICPAIQSTSHRTVKNFGFLQEIQPTCFSESG